MPRRDARSRSSAVATRRRATDALLVDERRIGADHVARLARVDVGGQLVPLPGRDARPFHERGVDGRWRMPRRRRARPRRVVPGLGRPAAPPAPVAVAVTAFATASRVRSASRACRSARSFDVADGAAAFVDGPVRHPQVRGDPLEVEVGRVDRCEREPPDRVRERPR